MLTWDDDAPQFLTRDERALLRRQAQSEEFRRQLREEEEAKACEWRRRFNLWKLTPFEIRLFENLDPDGVRGLDKATLLERLYGVPLNKRTKEVTRRKLNARLRKLQQRLNEKLRLSRAAYEVRPSDEFWLELVEIDINEKPASKPAKRSTREIALDRRAYLAELRKRGHDVPMIVEECEDRLRKILADGPVPTVRVNHRLRKECCRAGVIKKARKRLGVIARRVGFGGNGAWFLSLPKR